ncbi:MAG: cell division protein FtsZ [Alphaproteobacteria bacterium]|nr:cell division protein FtsZ [Alphaproteobacteria bacterium]
MAETKPVDITNTLGITLATPPPEVLLTPNIGVIGVGGAGGNAVNNMISSNLSGVNFFAANTDAQALSKSLCSERIQLGVKTTQGLGAGAHPEIGKASAEESADKLKEEITGLHLLFLTAGMGGGTGTGALPVIAKMAHEMGIMTVAVVSTPFNFEGKKRMETAKGGIEELKKYVDTMIVVPNQNLFRVAKPDTTFVEAFKMADDVLCQGVRSITDLIMNPGMVNLDFADLTTILKGMGRAMMGSGTASGENRAMIAAEKALSNPLLDDMSMKGAHCVLINVCAGKDLTLVENDIITQRITEEADPDANIIWGTTLNENLAGSIQVSIVATGLDPQAQTEKPEVPSTRPSITPVTPPENPIPSLKLDQLTEESQTPASEEPSLIPPSPFEFVPMTKVAAEPTEDLVVEGVEEINATQETLLPNTPPTIGPVEEVTTTVQTEDPINLEHKTAESNVTSAKPDLFKLVPALWNLRSPKQKHQPKQKDKEPPLPELDLTIPSFFK